MASPEFSTAEWRTLDDVLSLLRSPQPWFASVPAGRLCAACPKRSPHLSPPDLLAVSGNWYDVLHKAPVLARLAAAAPSADLFLAGGRRERLTSAEAAAEGGEPLLLGRTLAVLGVARSRLVVWSGSRVTNHNLRALLHYAKQRREFEPAAPPLRVALVEEGFLVRREAGEGHTSETRDTGQGHRSAHPGRSRRAPEPSRLLFASPSHRSSSHSSYPSSCSVARAAAGGGRRGAARSRCGGARSGRSRGVELFPPAARPRRAPCRVGTVEFRPVGARTFSQLCQAHNGRRDVAMARACIHSPRQRHAAPALRLIHDARALPRVGAGARRARQASGVGWA